MTLSPPMPASSEDESLAIPASSMRPSPPARVARGALALLSTQPFTWTASLLTTIFVPHYLGARALGTYAVALTLANLVAVIAALGIPNYVTRRVATRPERTGIDAGGALVLVLGTSLLLAIVLSLAVSFVRLPVPAVVLQLALAGMVVSTAQTVLLASLVGRERHARFAWLNALSVVIGAATGIAVLAIGGGIIALMAINLVGGIAVLVLSWRLSGFRLQREMFDPSLLRQIARGGLPFLGWNLATQIRNWADVMLTGLLVGQQAAGWLAAAYRIISVPVFIPTLIVTPLLPALSRVASDTILFRRLVRRSMTSALILTIPCSAGIFALAPSVPGLFHWSSEFDHSIPVMRILAVQQPIMAVDMIFAVALLALNQERRWLRALVFGATFNPALNLILLPLCNSWLHNGAIGAAIVEVTTELSMLAWALALLPSGTLDRETAGLSARVILAGLALLVVTSALRTWSLPLAIGAGGVSYFLAGAVLRVLRPDDLRELIHLVRRSRTGQTAGTGA